MKTLRAENLTSTYGEKTLFKDVSFIINEQDRIGLIGTNGSGKTSLLNVISGAVSPEAGEIIKPSDYSIGFLKQQPDLDEEKTIMDAVFAGGQPVFQTIRQYEKALLDYSAHPEDSRLSDRFTKMQAAMDQEDAWEADSRVKTILTQLKINDANQKIKELSGGQRKRVGLAQVLIQEPDLLMLDEPTNHLDIDSIMWLQDYLASYRGAVLVVTHDRYFLDQVANHIWELSFGKLYHYDGNYQDFVAQKATRVELAQEGERKRQALYKKELAWMRHGAKARSTKQKGRINRFNELKDNLGKLKVDEDISIELGSQRLGKDVIEMQHANLKYGDHEILDDFNWLVQAGDRIGITGENGAGKRMISYLTEVADNVVDKNGNRVNVTQLLERFLFPRFMHGTLIRKLSGGEKRRLYLLKILMQQPNVLLLDEPTNDLDIGTLTVLEDYLDDFAGTVITVSHDRYFLDKVADNLLIFHGQGKIERYRGYYTEYLKKAQADAQAAQAAKSAAKAAAKKTAAPAKTANTAKVKTKLTYAEKLEWDHIDEEIDQLDTRQKQIEEEMAANGDNYAKLAELQKELDGVQKALAEKTARWEYLSEFVDE